MNLLTSILVSLMFSSPVIYVSTEPQPQLKTLMNIPSEMLRIAECESNSKQFNNDGSVLISPTNDVGLFQLNIHSHKSNWERLGIDVYTLEGNIKYAMLLYEESGTKHWYMSSSCWR